MLASSRLEVSFNSQDRGDCFLTHIYTHTFPQYPGFGLKEEVRFDFLV